MGSDVRAVRRALPRAAGQAAEPGSREAVGDPGRRPGGEGGAAEGWRVGPQGRRLSRPEPGAAAARRGQPRPERKLPHPGASSLTLSLSSRCSRCHHRALLLSHSLRRSSHLQLAKPPPSGAQALSYATVLGMARALPAVAGELLEPCGYTSEVAGNAGALLAGCGVVGNLVVGPLMQRSKRCAAPGLGAGASAAGIARARRGLCGHGGEPAMPPPD